MISTNAIEVALTKLVDTEQMFTHYDVTKFARSFTNDNVRHNDVRSYVVGVFEDPDNAPLDVSDYDIDVVDVNGNQAVLYRPSYASSYDYDPNDIVTDKTLASAPSGCCGGKSACNTSSNSIIAAAQQAASHAAAIVKRFQTPAPAPAPAPAPTSKTRNVSIDNRGRVCIPKEYLERIGVKAGDMAHVHKSGVKGKLVIADIKWSPASHTHLGQYQADCYGNVRVPERILDQCIVAKIPFGNASSVTVRSESNHIVIE